MRPIIILLIAAAVATTIGASHGEARTLTLSQPDRQMCRSKGGHEGRAPFGAPICIPAFTDSGKVCSSEADCQGRCLSEAPENWQAVASGTPAVGHCESEKTMFGCHANVENGKLAEVYGCED